VIFDLKGPLIASCAKEKHPIGIRTPKQKPSVFSGTNEEGGDISVPVIVLALFLFLAATYENGAESLMVLWSCTRYLASSQYLVVHPVHTRQSAVSISITFKN
jgi:hypothetical protein